MSQIRLTIDGKEVAAKKGMTILQAAKLAGIAIPNLCNDEQLDPYGACRICTVEAESGRSIRYVAACLYPVEEELVVRTRSEAVDRIRKTLIELMLAHAPAAEKLKYLAQEYGADQDRFEKEASFCILCGLCVRYCAEVKKKHAVAFVESGARREIAFLPEIAARECGSCKECFPLCPTSALQAAYVLTEALAAPMFSP